MPFQHLDYPDLYQRSIRPRVEVRRTERKGGGSLMYLAAGREGESGLCVRDRIAVPNVVDHTTAYACLEGGVEKANAK